MVENAIAFDKISKEKLSIVMREITDLDNPNSVVQMKAWLSEQGIETESLGKKDVAKVMDEVDGEVKDALQLRQQLAKLSVKKYQAMQNAICADGRARGMCQFMGPTDPEGGQGVLFSCRIFLRIIWKIWNRQGDL